MKNYLKINDLVFMAFRLINYKISHKLNITPTKPLSLTLSLTEKCNSKCQTCNIWKNKTTNENLSIKEWEKTLENVGQVFWITLTGGEPFLYENIEQLVGKIILYNKPRFINIPTNGILTKKIIDKTKKINHICKKNGVQLKINVSIDGNEKIHNEIRGVKCFKKAKETIQQLKEIPRLKTEINLTISKYNVNKIEQIHNHLKKEFKNTNILFEVAQQKKELHNTENNFINTKDEEKAYSFLNKLNNTLKPGNLIQKFRNKYYKYLYETYKKRKKPLNCFAGIASTHISEKGEVWSCGVKTYSLGNLRDNEYKFDKIWKSKKAKKIRKIIKNKKCNCTIANNYYTNKLCSY